MITKWSDIRPGMVCKWLYRHGLHQTTRHHCGKICVITRIETLAGERWPRVYAVFAGGQGERFIIHLENDNFRDGNLKTSFRAFVEEIEIE